MDHDRAARIKRLFHEVLTQNPPERERFLKDTCGDEPDLYFAVKHRLDAYDDAPSWIDRAIVPLGPLSDFSSGLGHREDLAGQRVGPYRLLEPIGRGGTAVVWRAERADGLHRRVVAVKLIFGVATSDVLRRFRHEQQALASLDHPYICKLLDAGQRDDQTLFFVIELVNGLRIDHYCDRRRLSVRDRLLLFLKVCEAVSYAHGRLVVHRDIKPGNILVKEDGNPALLDFGISKLLDENRDEPTHRTQTVGTAFTPEFASPEQIAGLTVTTTSDVYSLGAMLYVLLTGLSARPVMTNAVVDLNRFVEFEPLSVSQVVTSGEDRFHETNGDAASRAALRGCTPDQLNRLLRGDLENIVSTALRCEPSRRYVSVERFASDIRNYLDHLPVSARPATWRYRAAKLVRRHRAATVAVTVGVIGLLATTGGTSIGLWKAAQRQRQLEIARFEAERARDDADAVTAYLESMLAAVRPERRGPNVLVRDVLDEAATSIPKRFSGQPLIEAQLRQAVGRSYDALGLPKLAEAQFTAALDIRRQALGADHPLTLSVINSLGINQLIQGRIAEAVETHRRNLEVYQRVLGPEDTRTLDSMNNLGNSLREAGQSATAVAIHRKALAIQQRVFGPDHEKTLLAMHNLALALDEQGFLTQAKPMHRKVLEARSRVLGDKHPDTLMSMHNLGYSLRLQGDLPEAEKILRRAAELQCDVLGMDHPDTLHTMNTLATVVRLAGRFDEAVAMFRDTLERSRRVLGVEHKQTAILMSDLGATLYDLGRFPEAEQVQIETLELQRKLVGEEHPTTLISRNNLALSRHSQGRHAEAERMHRETLAVMQRTLGPEHPHTLLSMKNLGASLLLQGRGEEAETLFRETLALRQRVLGTKHPDTLCSMYDLARSRCQQGNLQDAEELYRATIDGMRSTLGDDHPYVEYASAGLAEVLLLGEKFTEAKPLLEERLEKLIGRPSPDETSLAVTRSALGECLVIEHRYEEAEQLLVRAYERLAASQGAAGEDVIKTRNRLARLYQEWGKVEQAARYLTSAQPATD